MLFNSIHFFIFFPVITILFFVIPHKFRWSLLLVASCFFYMFFKPEYILILFFTIIIDYFAGIYLEKIQNQKQRKKFLIASLIANIGVLAIFKYFNFFNGNITGLGNLLGFENPIPYLSILLPIGLSFHTFQAMSYTIEIYKKQQKAERHFGIYALYVMFYPQLVAGPIERPQNLLYQFRKKHTFEYERIVEGLKLMVWGFFMKLVVADRLSIYVDAVYNNVGHHGGKSFILATIFFAFQIYCDFAGYSNIAIGAAKIMGFNLMTNFNRPYFSTSISEFWKRWHISLSTWFRDYLYISLGGNRVTVPRWYLNLFIVFVMSGLWHGANWTFIIWGALNGFYLVSAIIFSNVIKRISYFGLGNFTRINKTIQILFTFILICFAWIFFRANTIQDAFYIVQSIFKFSGSLFIDKTTIFYSLLALGMLLIIELKGEYGKESPLPFSSKYWLFEHLAYASIIIIIIFLGVFDGGQFIYFQF